MNKSDVIQDVAGVSGVSKSDVEKVIDAFFDAVRSAIGKGERVAWPSFGSFSSTQRQARSGRNPRTGEPVAIAASTAAKFSASTALKAALNPPPVKAAKKSAKSATPAKKATTGKKAAPAAAAAKAAAAKAAPAKAAPAKKAATPAKAAPAKATQGAKKSKK